MKQKLIDWIQILANERPDDTRGRPVPYEIYLAALEELNTPPNLVFTSKPVMEATGGHNALFCGHFIYPSGDA